MKTKQITTRWLGLALACGAITLANPALGKKPVKPPPPSPVPSLTYTLYPFDDGGMSGSRAVTISAAGLVPGYFESELMVDEVLGLNLGPPTLGTFTDTDGNGVLDLPRLLPVSPVDGYFAGRAFGVNEEGMVVGQTQRSAPLEYLIQYPPYKQAVIWRWDDSSGDYLPQRLGVIDWRLDESYAHRINGNGLVAGRCNSFAGVGGYGPAWPQAFVIQPAETPEGGLTWFRDEDADGVNDLMMRIWPGPGEQYLPWSDDPDIYYPPGPDSLIVDMNESGVVCGVIGNKFVLVPDFSDADGDGNPWFAADAEGNNSLVQFLTGLTGLNPQAVVAINDLGEIAGVSTDHAVLWKPVAGGGYAIQDLGTVSDRDYLSVRAMSDCSSEWLVGKAYSSPLNHAMKPLKNPLPDLLVVWWNGELLLPELTNGAGWTDLDFNDVNDSGVLAGSGVFNGKRTACLAVPNLP